MRPRDEDFKDWVRTLDCARCQKRRCAEPHHPRGALFGSGMGIKCPDWLCVPICRECHDFYHDVEPDAEEQRIWSLRTLILAVEQGALVRSQQGGWFPA